MNEDYIVAVEAIAFTHMLWNKLEVMDDKFLPPYPPEPMPLECKHYRPLTNEPHVITVCHMDNLHIHWFISKEKLKEHLLKAVRSKRSE